MNLKNNGSLMQLIGLCKRAGKLVSGEYLCEKSIKGGNAKLVIISEDASSNTKKKFKNMCEYYKTDMIVLGSREDLGHFIGKNDRVIISVLDNGFKQKIVDIANEESVGVNSEWQI